MTPRTVMLALDQNLSVQEVFEMHPNIPFARIPLFRETIDHICGIVRRRDLYNANVEGKTDQLLKNLGKEAVFVPENASADKALRLLLSEHCQLSIVVDEFGSVAGVLALEDIIETIIGQEIFEHDDMAVDMREFAIRKHKARIKEEKIQASEKSDPST
jgi:CBS domain containing-hemolysin-like protein